MAHKRKVYKAATWVNGEYIYLGYYDTKEEADAARVRYRTRKKLPIDPKEARRQSRALTRSLGLHSPKCGCCPKER